MKATLELRCTVHPTYTAKREPTADCEACRALWLVHGPTPAADHYAASVVVDDLPAPSTTEHSVETIAPQVTRKKVQELLDHLHGRFGDTYKYKMKESRKYFKIILNDIDPNSCHESVYCFVAKVDNITAALGIVKAGDLLKPASWSQPAKHARGSLFDKESWWKSFDKYGMMYLA